MRHSLDHFNTVFGSNVNPDCMDYDNRNRESDIEKCRITAISNCELLIGNLDNVRFDEIVKVKFLGDHVTGKSFV